LSLSGEKVRRKEREREGGGERGGKEREAEEEREGEGRKGKEREEEGRRGKERGKTNENVLNISENFAISSSLSNFPETSGEIVIFDFPSNS
jgi:hypothetical protein